MLCGPSPATFTTFCGLEACSTKSLAVLKRLSDLTTQTTGSIWMLQMYLKSSTEKGVSGRMALMMTIDGRLVAPML